MPLISSVSGIRGTIGGMPGDSLSPSDLIAFTGAYARWLQLKSPKPKVVIGRDARVSGEMVNDLVSGNLRAMGVDVIQTGLSTTPTVEMAVIQCSANGGIVLSASHNPANWNALKLLNDRGEFLSSEDGAWVLERAASRTEVMPGIESIGVKIEYNTSLQDHVAAIIQHPLVDVQAIKNKRFRIAADCINSTGSLALPILFEALGVEYVLINDDLSGMFAHDPEPLSNHLTALKDIVKTGFDLGIAVDPDVDRLALIDEGGRYIGEEYSLVLVADYVLDHRTGNAVSNLSSSRALRDVVLAKGGGYFASAVGEVHVVQKMKDVEAVIGGEGNGGIIVPDLHYGRDALIGIALALSKLAIDHTPLSRLRDRYPNYVMEKRKFLLGNHVDTTAILDHLAKALQEAEPDLTDGIKVDYPEGWVQVRRSNTEPVLRIYSEARDAQTAGKLADDIQKLLHRFNART